MDRSCDLTPDQEFKMGRHSLDSEDTEKKEEPELIHARITSPG
jgi:hypothetical protein